MVRSLRFLFLIVSLFMPLVLTSGPAAADQTSDGPRILAGTANVADILNDLVGDRAEIRQLIPGGACPGHYDLRPGDLLFLEKADLLILEAYQPGQSNMANLMQAVDNTNLQTIVLPQAYSTMLPPVQLQYTEVLSKNLVQRFPRMAGQIQDSASRRLEMIRQVSEAQAARLNGARGVPALCAAMQSGFAKWAGLDVVGTYGRPEDLAPEQYGKLLETGKTHNARLVLDNLQSGPGAGCGLAESLNAGQADLTSFPGGVPGQDDWASAFTGNVDRLLQALEESDS